MRSIVQALSRIRNVRNVSIGRKTLRLNLADRHEQEYFSAIKGDKRTIDQFIAEQFVREGDVVLDVGANIGFCTLIYLESNAAEVFAFEPHPSLFKRLSDLADNRIHTFNLALTDKVGTSQLLISSSHNQGHTLNERWLKIFPVVYGTSVISREIKTTTLDEYFKNKGFDFVKVDIEGSEAAFLSGASASLRNDPPRVLQIEIYPEVYEETIGLLHNFFKYIKRCVINRISKKIELIDLTDLESLGREDIDIHPPVYLCSNHFLVCGKHLPGSWTPQSGYMVNDSFSMFKFGGACLQKLLDEYFLEFSTVLDIGSGQGSHAEAFRKYGKRVTEVDFGTSCYFQEGNSDRDVIFGDYLVLNFENEFDLVWACHVLEHQKDVHQFLRKVHSDLKENGILAITVPPMKHEIVGGHVTVWNAGLLMYNLVLAGFDCRGAKILQYGYNISLILRKHSVVMPELAYDKGDIDRLSKFFPEGIEEPFDGNINELDWIA